MRLVRPASFAGFLLFGASVFAASVEVPTAPAYQLQISKSLSGATDALVTATTQNKTLQTKIDTLALHAGKLEMQVANDKTKLLRRDIAIASLALAIFVYAVLKFYLRVPFL
jgi:hypothetical protein